MYLQATLLSRNLNRNARNYSENILGLAVTANYSIP